MLSATTSATSKFCLLDSLPKKHPDWACEAIRCYLNRYVDLSLAAGQPDLFDRNSGSLPYAWWVRRPVLEAAIAVEASQALKGIIISTFCQKISQDKNNANNATNRLLQLSHSWRYSAQRVKNRH